MTERKRALRIMVAGGGTGGHIFPAIAIAEALKKMRPDTEFLFVGAEGKMEMEKVPNAGFKIIGLTIAGFNRSSLFKNIGLPFKLIRSFLKVASIIKKFKPDAVIGVGGYSSFPVLRYAQSKLIPTFIHEANSFAGKSNRLLAKKATVIFTGTEGMEKFFPPEKIIVSGNPVRMSLVESTISREEGVSYFGLDKKRTTILSIGGSLGARSINEVVESNLKNLTSDSLQLIWQTGKNFKQSEVFVSEHYYASPFIDKMQYALAAADIVISRSGAMSVAELCLAGKPVVFVPYPHAAENHQYENAAQLVQKEAALLVEDKNVKHELMSVLMQLSTDIDLQKKLTQNILKEGKKNADEVVASSILQYLEK